MEASNLSEKELKVTVIRIFKSIKNNIETIINNRSKMKNVISEIQNRLERIISRLNKAESWSVN